MTSTSRTGRRRLPADERRAEILRAAGVIAVREGLDKLTAKRVAQAVGVVPGLVDYHFKSADELIAAAFSHAATADNDAVFEEAERVDHPVDRVRQLMQAWLHEDRDPVSLFVARRLAGEPAPPGAAHGGHAPDERRPGPAGSTHRGRGRARHGPQAARSSRVPPEDLGPAPDERVIACPLGSAYHLSVDKKSLPIRS